jgi:hypothetical protein
MILFIFPLLAYANTLCADGWVSRSKGRGTCSHHGGIARPEKDLDYSDKKPDPAVPSSSVFLGTEAKPGGEKDKVISLTVKDMLPLLSNSEAAEIWVEDTQHKTIKGTLDETDPNDRNKHTNMRDLVPAVWNCFDGEGKDKVSFLCWEEDETKCTPEWHSLLGLSCPVVCEKGTTKPK